MACFTVAVGFLRIGTTFLDPATCVAIAQVLWIVGALATSSASWADFESRMRSGLRSRRRCESSESEAACGRKCASSASR